jgi:hypothetical protein
MTSKVQPGLSPPFQRALRSIGRRLKDFQSTWAISGSLGFWLHGMQVTPADIDLQTTEKGAYLLEEALGGIRLKRVRFSQAESIRSHYGAQKLEGVKVEIMGAVEKRLPNGAWDPPPKLEQVLDMIRWEGFDLPVVSLEYEMEAYRTLGRHRRAAQIEAFLKTLT